MKIHILTLSMLLALQPVIAAEPTARAAAAATRAAIARAAAPAPMDAEQSAEARRELDELRTQIGDLSRRMGELSGKLGEVGPRAYALRYLNEPDRAIIGVVLSPEPRGPRIDAVTPDSPAERAGLRSGDLITRINGEALAANEPSESLGKARGLLDGLKQGQEVRIVFQRGGVPGGEVILKAQRREALNWPRLFTGDDEVDLSMPAGGERQAREDARVTREAMVTARTDAERANGDASRSQVQARRSLVDAQRAMEHAEIARIDAERHAMPWWGISLASLDSDLGRYFGSDTGVLVLSASADTLPDLKAGDVIRKVAGQPVMRPEEALRALRDQPTGSTVTLEILRDRKSLVLSVNIPEHKSIFSVGRIVPLPPLPPKQPNPPMPPAMDEALEPPAPPSPENAPAPAIAPTGSDGFTGVSSLIDFDLRGAMVSPDVALKGASTGAPALWGGEIIDRRMRSGNACLRVHAFMLDGKGKPIAGARTKSQFLACDADPLEPQKFRTHSFATFAGHVQSVDEGRFGENMPVLLVTDAKVWKSMPGSILLAPTPMQSPRR